MQMPDTDAAMRYAHDTGFDEGYEVGYEEGYDFGWEAGYEVGYSEGIDSMDPAEGDGLGDG